MQLFPHKIDLHLHSALSPCAEKEMTPPKIIHAARAKGLKMIAITDHNTAENAGATIEAAKGSGIFVIPGMEVQTREEVHVICLFPSLSACHGRRQFTKACPGPVSFFIRLYFRKLIRCTLFDRARPKSFNHLLCRSA